jgi:5-methyltetrahydrofolate--homocysteine methyltransferase
VVYVPDASRSVGVCADLLSDERATRFIDELKSDYEKVRTLHAAKKPAAMVTLAEARANKTPIDWSAYTPPKPKFLGRRVFRNYDLAELSACIDWGPFFQTWDLAGAFPQILKDEVVGAEAQRVFSDGKRLLQRLIEGRWLQAAGVIGLYPANTVDDDVIELYADESRQQVLLRWQPLRLQTERPVVDGVKRPNRSLADFVAPKGRIVIATVKGDVHDIGKNIVSVVLQCNNFEVVNMGVMVPCQDILAKAKVEGADLIGLSGLITPSLEEMQHVAAEMQRDEWFRVKKIPLLIGGATTSRVHTAVKIAPHYDGPVVYVPDASRSVGVCADLLSDQRAAKFLADLTADYDKVRALHAAKKPVAMVTLQQARANKTPVDWSTYVPPKPKFIGRRVFRNQDLSEIAACIDWGPFFQTWDLAGKFPEILRDEIVGAEATRVLSDGKRMLQRLIEGRWLQAHGVIGLWPANTVDDDCIELYTDESRRDVLLRWWPLRMQTERPVIDGVRRPNRCLADFVAPRGVRDDYVGLFAVTAGVGVEKKEKQFLADHDDYSAIMLKALADRLAEAFAERLHQRVRTDLWGYAADEALANDELIAEKYRGIRPAPGYPACPDHTIKRALFEALQAREIGMDLTESLAMTPAASVSGFYLAHPEASYFNVGRIARDQLDAFARAMAIDAAAAQRALASVL